MALNADTLIMIMMNISGSCIEPINKKITNPIKAANKNANKPKKKIFNLFITITFNF